VKNPDTLRICFLGCGNITSKHAKLARATSKDISLSFASRTLTKAEEFSSKYNGDKSFGSYDDALTAEDVDIIMINTPPDSHFDLASKAIENGKHVIVEKPPFYSSEDFDVLGPKADQKGLQLLVAENYFYRPLRKTLQSLFENKVIGIPLFMNINATKKQENSNDWREDKSIVKYGALYEGGIHWMSIINNLGFSVESYDGFNPRKEQELERSMQMTAKTKEGLIINLLYSWEVDTIFKGLRLSKIHGTEGSITFETNGVFVVVRGNKKRVIWPGFTDIGGSKAMWKDFLSSIKNAAPAAYTWRMAQQDLLAVETTYSTSI
jgi:predicted dehydrogenase